MGRYDLHNLIPVSSEILKRKEAGPDFIGIYNDILSRRHDLRNGFPGCRIRFLQDPYLDPFLRKPVMLGFLKSRRQHLPLCLHAVPEFKAGFPNKRLEIFLPDEIWKNLDEGFNVKLLAEDAKRFELKPSKPDSLTVPKK